VTGGLHKLASMELIKDLNATSHLVPDWQKDGMVRGMLDIANGKFKEGPFKAAYSNPVNIVERAINLTSGTCNWNMFFFRGLYIGGFAWLGSRAEKGMKQMQKELKRETPCPSQGRI
jgi:hypothetical protein